jgi:ectoine hydroxylase-related dioxygenase (phytanoyl-CoA dioxygenase family)
MLTRVEFIGGIKYLAARETQVPEESVELEEQGYTIVRKAFNAKELKALRTEINKVYDERQPDSRYRDKLGLKDSHHFRYEMYNHGPLCQAIVGRREILDVIEPLLGEDCHIIANTCWRNPPGEVGQAGAWHLDGGPHIPLRPGQVWPENLPHPVFAIGAHIFLIDCPRKCGPTGVIPGSHKSGTHPPVDRLMDGELSWNGIKAKPLIAKAGDVALFVSDMWHRRLPTQKADTGRFFLQVHYARRDIAQRVKTTESVNHVDPAAIQRIASDRERRLLGLHPMQFYDG